MFLSGARGGTHSAGFEEEGPDSAAAMEHAYKWILKYGGGLAFILIIAWPCLALPAGVFSKGYFTFWVIISIIWGLVSPPVLFVLGNCPKPQSCMVSPEGVSSKGYFTFWVIISIIWGLVSLSASACSAVMPSCSRVWCRQRVSSAMAIAFPGCCQQMAWGVLCPQTSLCIAHYRLIVPLAWALVSHADRSCQPLLQRWSTTVDSGVDREVHCVSAER